MWCMYKREKEMECVYKEWGYKKGRGVCIKDGDIYKGEGYV